MKQRRAWDSLASKACWRISKRLISPEELAEPSTGIRSRKLDQEGPAVAVHGSGLASFCKIDVNLWPLGAARSNLSDRERHILAASAVANCRLHPRSSRRTSDHLAVTTR